MPNASPLPDDLRGGPFSVSDAQSRGVTRSRLRASDLYAPFHGTRLPSASTSLRQRCMAWQSIAPADSYVSHSTAALLFGCPLPRRLETTKDIHVTVVRPRRPPRASRVVGHSVGAGRDTPINSRGLRMSTAEQTWLELGTQLDFLELVAAGDYLLRGFREPNGTRRPFTTVRRLREAAAAHPGRRHRKMIDRALDAVRERVDSPKETELRLLLQEAGFPELIVNEPVRDDTGRVLACPDLRVRGYNLGIEYKGFVHATSHDAWENDIRRERNLDDIDWKTIDVMRSDLKQPHHIILVIERELQKRGWTGSSTWPGLHYEPEA
ncbi:hypothetical protein ITJ38_11200 [Agreia pratensis]|uniref:hypothetical protein n=1 Tax=Agreia pratensis TaxID=150121 RepID=UPI00188A522D|nr:hypothetical protein [Agreia pratensis]MBF4634970.1 hypothetical protein [Agreia pratensis]